MERPLLKRQRAGQAVVVHPFGPHSQEAEAGGSLEFEDSLDCKNSRTVRDTRRNLVSKNKKERKEGRKDRQVLTEM